MKKFPRVKVNIKAEYETEWIGFTGRIKIGVSSLKMKLWIYNYSEIQRPENGSGKAIMM